MSSPSIGLTFIVHLKIISKLEAGTVSKIKVVLANAGEVIRILMRVIRLTNGKPCTFYNTCDYMIFMTWVISMNNFTVM